MKIDFEVVTRYGTFCDSLNLPDDVTFTDEALQAMKQQRVDNWISVIEAPPVDEAV